MIVTSVCVCVVGGPFLFAIYPQKVTQPQQHSSHDGKDSGIQKPSLEYEECFPDQVPHL